MVGHLATQSRSHDDGYWGLGHKLSGVGSGGSEVTPSSESERRHRGFQIAVQTPEEEGWTGGILTGLVLKDLAQSSP